MENRLRWIIRKRFEAAPVRRGILVCIEDGKKKRGRLKVTWMEVVRKDRRNLK